jgi:hypothetical protein
VLRGVLQGPVLQDFVAHRRLHWDEVCRCYRAAHRHIVGLQSGGSSGAVTGAQRGEGAGRAQQSSLAYRSTDQPDWLKQHRDLRSGIPAPHTRQPCQPPHLRNHHRRLPASPPPLTHFCSLLRTLGVLLSSVAATTCSVPGGSASEPGQKPTSREVLVSVAMAGQLREGAVWRQG